MAAVTPVYLSGYLGAMEIDNVALPIRSWSGTHSVGSADVTNSTSSGARNVIRTIEQFDGSAEVVWKVTSGAPAFLVGSVYSVELITSGSQKYTFNALIKSVAPKADIKGDVMYTVSFESDGAITAAS